MIGRWHVVEEGELLLGGAPSTPIDFDPDMPELIDETRAPHGFLDVDLSRAEESRPHHASTSAIPQAQPMVTPRASLPWGLGTDGWPHQKSRLVRLFLCDRDRLIDGCSGKSWGALSLSNEVAEETDAEQTASVPGWLQMPYPSIPLDVELRAQPFERRFTRVDLVLLSKHRWPRRYFDVASVSLTRMQRLERRPRVSVAAGSTGISLR